MGTLADWLDKIWSIRGGARPYMAKVRAQYTGVGALSREYHPLPVGWDDTDWQGWERLRVLCNVLRPWVRAVQSAVYSGTARRTVVGNSPFAEVVQAWAQTKGYRKAMRQLLSNAALYGTAVALPTARRVAVGDSGGRYRLGVRLFDPVATFVRLQDGEVEAVAECVAQYQDTDTKEQVPARMEWRDASGDWQRVGDLATTGVPREYGFIPALVAHYEDELWRGRAYGRTPAPTAADFTIRLTDVLFNVLQMQKMDSRALLALFGEEAPADEEGEEGIGQLSTLRMEKDARAEYLAPNAKIAENLEIMRQMLAVLATVLGVPADVLDSTLTTRAGSAEAAKIRVIPLVQESDWLSMQWAEYEEQFLVMMVALLEQLESGAPVDLEEVQGRVTATVQLRPKPLPIGTAEDTTTRISKMAAGLITPEEAILEEDATKTEQQVEEMAAAIRERAATLNQSADAASKITAAQDSVMGAAALGGAV